MIEIYKLFLIAMISLVKSQNNNNKKYTTNVYGRKAFECYNCINNLNSINSRGKFDQATSDCGFNSDFRPFSPYVKKEICYTYCMKREVGTIGSKIDVERRCEPNCQEYNGNTNKVKYLIDKVSCCVGNLCNSDTRLIESRSILILSACFNLIKIFY